MKAILKPSQPPNALEQQQLSLQLSPQGHLTLHVEGDCYGCSHSHQYQINMPAISSDDIAQFAVQLFALANAKLKEEEIASQKPAKFIGNLPPEFKKALAAQQKQKQCDPMSLISVNDPQSHL